MPSRTPDHKGCEIAWYYRPCDELGGDFLNVFSLGSEHIGLYLLDVSGHGIPRALMSVAVSRALAPSVTDTCIVIRPSRDGSNQPHQITPRAQVADRLNRRFPMDFATNQYFTLIYDALEHQTRLFRFTSAGHPPIIYAPHLEKPRMLVFSGDPRIGVFRQTKAATLALQGAVDFLSKSVCDWCGEGKSPQDDVSILALEISG